MAELYVVKRGGMLMAADDEDRETIRKFKPGQAYRAKIWLYRNGQFHRKTRKLLRFAFENQDRYDNFEHFVTEIKIRAGHCDTYVTGGGEVRYIPLPTDYNSMDQAEAEKYYVNLFNAISRHVFGDLKPQELARIEHEMMRFT